MMRNLPRRGSDKERVLHRDEKLDRKLARALAPISNALFHLLLRNSQIMAKLDELEREVAETEGAVDSAIALIKGLRDEIANAGTDPVKLAELVSRLDSKQQALAKAVANEPDEGGSTGGV